MVKCLAKCDYVVIHLNSKIKILARKTHYMVIQYKGKMCNFLNHNKKQGWSPTPVDI